MECESSDTSKDATSTLSADLRSPPSDLPRAAKELVQLNPDVIVATASANALAAKMATSTIPIVVPALGNPVALGLIETIPTQVGI